MKGTMRNWIAVTFLAMASLAIAADVPKAIQFELADIDGKPVRLTDYRGKWVLVNFFAPWCPLCWPEVPALNALNSRKDLVVIGVGMDYGPDEQTVREAITRHDIRFAATVLGGSRRDPASPSRQIGPVDFFPTSYLYNPEGEIVMFLPGPTKEARVLAAIEHFRAVAARNCPKLARLGSRRSAENLSHQC